jgi:hypothetical protein
MGTAAPARPGSIARLSHRAPKKLARSVTPRGWHGPRVGGLSRRTADHGRPHPLRLMGRRQTRSRIREIERLNPGMKVTLTPIDPAGMAA